MANMSPKLITLHLFRAKSQESFKLEGESADVAVLVNPRRVDYFASVTPPTQQPTLYCGTRVCLGSKSSITVRETLADIKRLLK